MSGWQGGAVLWAVLPGRRLSEICLADHSSWACSSLLDPPLSPSSLHSPFAICHLPMAIQPTCLWPSSMSPCSYSYPVWGRRGPELQLLIMPVDAIQCLLCSSPDPRLLLSMPAPSRHDEMVMPAILNTWTVLRASIIRPAACRVPAASRRGQTMHYAIEFMLCSWDGMSVTELDADPESPASTMCVCPVGYPCVSIEVAGSPGSHASMPLSPAPAAVRDDYEHAYSYWHQYYVPATR